MTIGTKIGMVAFTGAGVVGSSAGIAYAFSPSPSTPVTIEKQIENDGKKILINDNSKNTLWNIKLSTYKAKFHEKLAFEKQDANTLKGWCEENLKKNFENKDDSNYLAAKELCVVPNNEEKLLSIPKTLAKTEDWQGIASTYNSSAAGNNLISEINKGSANAGNIENWCKGTLAKEYLETSNLNTPAEKWCTKG